MFYFTLDELKLAILLEAGFASLFDLHYESFSGFMRQCWLEGTLRNHARETIEISLRLAQWSKAAA